MELNDDSDVYAAAPHIFDRRVSEIGAALSEARRARSDLADYDVAAGQRLDGEITALHGRLRDLSGIHRERGGWSRVYLVARRGGHVHKSRSCGTLRPTTQLLWLTDYSGQTDTEIVRVAGWRACHSCFPGAPQGDEISLPGTLEVRELYAAARASRSSSV